MFDKFDNKIGLINYSNHDIANNCENSIKVRLSLTKKPVVRLKQSGLHNMNKN